MEQEFAALEHVGTFNTFLYTVDENNAITNHTNWKGSAEGYGAVFGTLSFAPIPLNQMNDSLEGGEVRWTGQGFLEDGTNVAGTGVGTWEKVPGSTSGRPTTFSQSVMELRLEVLAK
jgi:hypothetical protein